MVPPLARHWRARAAVVALICGLAPLTVAHPALAAPLSQTDLQIKVVSHGPVPGANRYRVTVEMHNNGPQDVTEGYLIDTEFRTATTVVDTLNLPNQFPATVPDNSLTIASLIFNATNGCRNVACSATIRLADPAGNFGTDLNPNNDTIRIVDGRILEGGP